jgi:hypothetical protein
MALLPRAGEKVRPVNQSKKAGICKVFKKFFVEMEEAVFPIRAVLEGAEVASDLKANAEQFFR